ncbi:hypothetical protein [uncultured Victivallis sp.]|uniref:hypothetical protein n=1 Tax=uncultured Victivallis sp. TaxID=354118 RepID=UPI0025F54F5C|nr:hypothetical protein [uncultured Victivallis sp.]
MRTSFRDFVKTGKGKLTVALCALGLSWIFLLWNFSGSFGELLPGEERIDALEREIKQLKQQNATLLARRKAADELKERYRKQLESYWHEERDGVVETELRNKIQQAASEIELKLNSLGSVRTTRINNELYYAEIDLSTSGTLETLVRFLGRIQEIRPSLSWRRLDLRPEMRNTDLIGNMNFNGAIRIIGFDGEEPDRKGGTK